MHVSVNLFMMVVPDVQHINPYAAGGIFGKYKVMQKTLKND